MAGVKIRRGAAFPDLGLVRAIRPLWIALLLLLPAVAQAQFTFTTNNGAITITGYTGPGGAVTIPDTTNGYPVTSIGSYAFNYKLNLTSITIPNSVISIGYDAFFDCTNLTNVTIGTNVTSIGDDAFFHCTSMTSVIIPDSVTNIGFGGLASCTSLTNVTIGTNVANIGNSAFSYCSSLTSVTIPNSVTDIGFAAFQSCSSLTNVMIPKSVINIGGMAFFLCTSLTAIKVDALNSIYCCVDGVLLNKAQTTLIQCPAGKAGGYTIPNSVTSIGDWAFYHCASLTNVTIPNSVIRIGDITFGFCTNLTTVMIPNSVTTIGSEAFAICASLTAIMVDTNNPAYASGDGVLFNKIQTTLIQCSGDQAGSYTVPNSVTSIGYYAFGDCTKLTNVMIGNSVTNIGVQAFADCDSLTAIMVDTNNPAYASVAGVLFNQSQTALIQCPGGQGGSYTVPDSVTSIGNFAFSYCTKLTNVMVGNSVTNIGAIAFSSCISLIGVYFTGNSPTPTNDTSVFNNDSNTTIYYLPGTTGWGLTFDGRPTALWLPQVQTTGASFGVQSNQFAFNINWASDTVVVVEACTNLANPVWNPVSTNMLTSGTSYFSDLQWTNYPDRYYRLRSP
jgi:hypothetical protein